MPKSCRSVLFEMAAETKPDATSLHLIDCKSNRANCTHIRAVQYPICGAPEEFCIAERSGRLVEVSDAMCRMLGYSSDEMRTMHISDWNDGWDKVVEVNIAPPDPNAAGAVETVLRCKDGAQLYVEIQFSSVCIDGRELLCIASRDITARKNLEQEMRIAAVAFEAQEAMLITDADRTILRANPAFIELSGYSSVELVGQNLEFLCVNHNDKSAHPDISRQLNEKGFWRGEMLKRRKSGEDYQVWLTITAVKGIEGFVSNYVVTEIDITHRKAAEREIEELAYFDPLTKLGNRRMLQDRLEQALISCQFTGNRGAVLFIDLDHFKTINDIAGHEIGDQLLQGVANRLTYCVRDIDTVTRLGGDEFVVILTDLEAGAERAAILTAQIGERILTTLNAPYYLAGQEYFSSPSVGVAVFGREGGTVNDLLRHADLAMYQAKASGRNTLRYYDPAMQVAITTRAKLEGALRYSLQNDGFVLHYQAQVASDGKLIGAEALLRWHHPQYGWLAPNEFIPVAEESGLLVQLAMHVLVTACRQIVKWGGSYELGSFSLAVNVSARQIRQPDFVEKVLSTLNRSGVDPHRIKLELTESMLVDNVEDTIAKMTALKAHGIGFSLDDFGTGYSSLSYLKRLPLDQLKIDRSFVSDVLYDQNDAAIAKTIVALSQSLNLCVIAEGVETEEQRRLLLEYGCFSYQGYLFGRPVAAANFEAYLRGYCGIKREIGISPSEQV